MVPRGKKKQRDATKAPIMVGVRNCDKTLVARTQGTKNALEELKGRAMKFDLAELSQRGEVAAAT